MAEGFNYFDTARVYLGGKSETAIRECVSKRYKREDFVLVDKLSNDLFKTEEEVRPLLKSSLNPAGGLFRHLSSPCSDQGAFRKYKKCRAYGQAFELKAEGKIKHVGLSFHDKAEVLEQILTEYPELEVVQIQFNYGL